MGINVSGGSLGGGLFYVKTENVPIGTGIGGAQTADLFNITGIVEIVDMFFVMHDIVDSTTFADVGMVLNDGVGTVAVTDVNDCSGLLDFDTIIHEGGGMDGSWTESVLNLSVNDFTVRGPVDCETTIVSGTAGSMLTLSYLEDASTELQIDFYIAYRKLSADAVITAI